MIVNVLEALDTKGEVTRVSGEAQIALEAGDTPLSTRLFVQAGKMLESAVARLSKASERDLARFLAATHYYKGGAYQEAARVCARIQAGRLPSRVRHLYPPFLKDVKERSAPDYTRRYTAMVADFYQRVTKDGDPTAAQGVIDLLIAHPYLFPRDRMAYMRARCCDILGHRRAATLFFRDAWRFDPDSPLYALAYLDSLCKEGRYAEAWAVVEERLEKHPGALSSIYAMSVINAIRDRDRAANAPADEQVRRRDELLGHFASALEACQSMAPAERRAIAPQIDYAFLITWAPYREVHDVGEQLDLINRWIELHPGSWNARNIRGMVTYPGDSSNQAFRDAIELGSSDPLPYYVLAGDALLSHQFLECDRLCTQALQRGPEPEARAMLLFCQAISRWNLHRDKIDSRALFEEARRLKPDDSSIAFYARAFEESDRAPNHPPQISPEAESHWRDQSQRYIRKRSEETSPGREAIPA
jgi:tetratricopeptide (TPR) repeat protein